MPIILISSCLHLFTTAGDLPASFSASLFAYLVLLILIVCCVCFCLFFFLFCFVVFGTLLCVVSCLLRFFLPQFFESLPCNFYVHLVYLFFIMHHFEFMWLYDFFFLLGSLVYSRIFLGTMFFMFCRSCLLLRLFL